MKLNFLNSKSALALVFAVLMSGSLLSCVPTYDSGGGDPGSTSPDKKPDPDNVKSMYLYSDSGDNIAGLGFHRDGYLTSLTSADWYFASIGYVPGIGNVDYIPVNNWDVLMFPHVGEGLVAYSPTQGFVRMLIGAIVNDEQGRPVAVGLEFLGGFSGVEDPLELKEWSFDFDENGGSAVAELSGKKYATYQLQCRESWLKVRQSYSTYKFIYDRINIEVEPNPTTEERRALVTVRTSSGKDSTFTVIQAGKPEEDSEDEE